MKQVQPISVFDLMMAFGTRAVNWRLFQPRTFRSWAVRSTTGSVRRGAESSSSIRRSPSAGFDPEPVIRDSCHECLLVTEAADWARLSRRLAQRLSPGQSSRAPAACKKKGYECYPKDTNRRVQNTSGSRLPEIQIRFHILTKVIKPLRSRRMRRIIGSIMPPLIPF